MFTEYSLICSPYWVSIGIIEEIETACDGYLQGNRVFLKQVCKCLLDLPMRTYFKVAFTCSGSLTGMTWPHLIENAIALGTEGPMT